MVMENASEEVETSHDATIIYYVLTLCLLTAGYSSQSYTFFATISIVISFVLLCWPIWMLRLIAYNWFVDQQAYNSMYPESGWHSVQSL